MHIAIDARFYRKSTAGIGRYTRGLINELVKIDHKNEYTIFITPEDEEEFDEEIKNLKLKIKNFHKYVVPITHYTIAEQTKFLQILNDGKFDLVHFTNLNHPILYRGKFVITIHDLTLLLYPHQKIKKSLLRNWALNATFKSAIKNSQKIIAISEATKNDLMKYLHADPDKIKVIYEGVDKAYRQNSKLKIQNSNPYLLFVSQWRPHKGLPELIKAWEILKDKYKIPHQLVLIGKPNPDFPEVIDAVEKSKFTNEIIRPGFVEEEDLPILYHQAEAFIFPSHYEGFGLPPLEAMASGAPVVASNASCMPEILGDAAVYFDPSNPIDIADKIQKTLINTDLRNKMIKKGFEQVKKYSWQKMAEETLQIYKEVLK